MEFKKDSYIVLLTSSDGKNCWGGMPINHIYKLSKDSDPKQGFSIYRNIRLCEDGWYKSDTSKYVNKLKFRKAFDIEIDEYNKINEPVDILKLKHKVACKLSDAEKCVKQANIDLKKVQLSNPLILNKIIDAMQLVEEWQDKILFYRSS